MCLCLYHRVQEIKHKGASYILIFTHNVRAEYFQKYNICIDDIKSFSLTPGSRPDDVISIFQAAEATENIILANTVHQNTGAL